MYFYLNRVLNASSEGCKYVSHLCIFTSLHHFFLKFLLWVWEFQPSNIIVFINQVNCIYLLFDEILLWLHVSQSVWILQTWNSVFPSLSFRGTRTLQTHVALQTDRPDTSPDKEWIMCCMTEAEMQQRSSVSPPVFVSAEGAAAVLQGQEQVFPHSARETRRSGRFPPHHHVQPQGDSSSSSSSSSSASSHLTLILSVRKVSNPSIWFSCSCEASRMKFDIWRQETGRWRKS